jgi:hypothetical protein
MERSAEAGVEAGSGVEAGAGAPAGGVPPAGVLAAGAGVLVAPLQAVSMSTARLQAAHRGIRRGSVNRSS